MGVSSKLAVLYGMVESRFRELPCDGYTSARALFEDQEIVKAARDLQQVKWIVYRFRQAGCLKQEPAKKMNFKWVDGAMFKPGKEIRDRPETRLQSVAIRPYASGREVEIVAGTLKVSVWINDEGRLETKVMS
jgi:hypothetical protein